MNPVVSVVLVDSHPIVRCGLRAMFSAVPDIKVVADVESGTAGVTAAKAHGADVLLVELSELSGIKPLPDTALIVFTTRQDEASLRMALKAGARGYILKTAEQRDIIRAIHAVAAGELIFGRPVAAQLPLVLRHPTNDRFFGLTSRQREVADLVAVGLGNNAIAQRLGMMPKTVRNHISQILATLGVPSRADLRHVAS